MDDDVSWSQAELVRLAWAARRDSLARGELLQAFQAGADFYAPLSSRDLDDDPFVAVGDCVAAIVMRELTGAGEAEAWLHTFLRAHELRQDLPPPLSATCKGKRRF
ncbi:MULTISPECIES: hypothetical protein [unclassified Stenotrophomonas]|uniref:hypothetical protein n=1 Tax=unclassified Stenotrophomonas TaxID=196198 RepID=UPI0017824F7B|nr:MULTISPECIES: hypothetical protein [unclassified Stenotrophomonas]MBD8636617.1 hypothetical protein [Stenotrophomonas sp. CFBP 13725]MBD8696801.1 hypothetical protein [Stenotrophomonas sp. CFBP 13718]